MIKQTPNFVTGAEMASARNLIRKLGTAAVRALVMDPWDMISPEDDQKTIVYWTDAPVFNTRRKDGHRICFENGKYKTASQEDKDALQYFVDRGQLFMVDKATALKKQQAAHEQEAPRASLSSKLLKGEA
jgi:hypothetical protein